MASIEGASVDPFVSASFKIAPTNKVATAGSCFAQHISKNLVKRGFNYFVAESAPSVFPSDLTNKLGYGVFSARFGNIYTARQLLQLFDRAYGKFIPAEQPWEQGGRLYDPFRPSVEADGYANRQHFNADQTHHLASVRKMFEELDVFVFTLGLTEAWISKEDGAVFPVAPGCGYGTSNMDRYEFHNFSVGEIMADMTAFLSGLKAVNPSAKVILTVSPVPLIATYEPRHVLVSTTYSKSVLRVVADEIERSHDNVLYFPSYEIITGAHSRGAYYAADLREIEAVGVDHVMRIFFRHLSDGEKTVSTPAKEMPATKSVTDIICDEELLVGGNDATGR